ncbi:MAG TPA: FG-GAP repeat protein, partial [Longimicrobiales bacterium]|nr:FG-GAP repeat protein [Longimicrobiales bacterium]
MRKIFPLFLAVLLTAAATTPVAAQTYGNAVAVADGTVLVAEPAATARPGTIHIYRPDADGGWTEGGQIQAPGARAGDGFAAAIAVDGDLLLASRPADGEGRGAVYVFRRQGAEWAPAGRIVPEGAVPGDSAGVALAVSGRHAIIGSIRAGGGTGASWIYRLEGAEWVHAARLTGSDAARGDAFGAVVALSGERAAVGAPLQGSRRGAAYVYSAGPAGWAQEAKLVARTTGQGDHFGASLAMRGDTVFVGAPTRDAGAGTVFIFTPSGEGQWASAMRLFPLEGPSDARFGTTLTVLGAELFTGAPGARGYRGAFHQLVRDDSGAWARARVVVAEDTERGDNLGATFATDGRVAVAGLPGDDRGAGTAVIFVREGEGWREAAKVASDPALYAAVTGGQVDCAGGQATAFECADVDL